MLFGLKCCLVGQVRRASNGPVSTVSPVESMSVYENRPDAIVSGRIKLTKLLRDCSR